MCVWCMSVCVYVMSMGDFNMEQHPNFKGTCGDLLYFHDHLYMYVCPRFHGVKWTGDKVHGFFLLYT